MKGLMQRWFDRIALAILRPALISEESEKLVFGVTTDDASVLERIPADRKLIGKDFVLSTAVGSIKVLGIDDEDGLISVLHANSGELHELNIDTFELLFVQPDVTTA